MKICIIVENFDQYGGGKVHLDELIKRLIKRYKCKIDIYTRKLIIDCRVYDYNSFNGNLRVFRCGICSKYPSIVGRISWILDVINHNIHDKYDIIHGQANLGGIPTWIIGRLKRTPTVFTVHGSGLLVWDKMASGISKNINYLVEKLVQTQLKYDAEISVDNRFCNLYNINKPIVIPNGVDIKEFDKINVPKDKNFKIIFVGRLHPQKGLKYLIDAVYWIEKIIREKKVKIHLIGSGEEQPILEKQMKDLGIEDIFIFRGKIFGEDLIREYKSAHLFVLPSIFEGQPLTLLEAGACKLPVLVTDVGDNDKFVKNGINGVIIPPANMKPLANILKAYIIYPYEKYISFGQKGYTLVKKEYTWDKMTEKTYEVYKKCLKKK